MANKKGSTQLRYPDRIREAESGYKACLTEWAQSTRQPELIRLKTIQNTKQPAAQKTDQTALV